jgi:hypothetical protein
MLVVLGGRERTKSEYGDLFARSGFQLTRILRTHTPQSVVEAIRVRSALRNVVLSRFTTLGAYVVSAWLTLIGLSLIFSGHYLDVAIRDVVMAVGAGSLGVLSEVLAESRSQASSYEPALAKPASM